MECLIFNTTLANIHKNSRKIKMPQKIHFSSRRRLNEIKNENQKITLQDQTLQKIQTRRLVGRAAVISHAGLANFWPVTMHCHPKRWKIIFTKKLWLLAPCFPCSFPDLDQAPGGKIDLLKQEKVKKFHVLKCWMFSFEG